jgi:hypothetical protein
MKQLSSTSSFKGLTCKILIPYLIIVTISLAIVDLLFSQYIILNTPSSGASKVVRINKNQDPKEIPIFGSSRAEGSFIPDSLGKGFFNYGMAGVQDDVWLYFLKTELSKKRKTPILINLDIDGLQHLQSGLAYWLFNVDDPNIRKFIGEQWKPIHSIPVLRHFGHFETYISNFVKERIKLTSSINNGAILELKSLTENGFKAAVELRKSKKITLSDDPKISDEIFNVISDTKGRKIIFIIPPYHESYLSSITNIENAQELHHKIEKYPNVYLMDYSNLNFPDSLFYNTSHLNLKGAIKFNAILKMDLNNLLQLPNE